MTKQIDIQELIPFMEDGWVTMDKNGDWYWYKEEPEIRDNRAWDFGGVASILSRIFNIAPAEDWTKSLIKVENKDE